MPQFSHNYKGVYGLRRVLFAREVALHSLLGYRRICRYDPTGISTGNLGNLAASLHGKRSPSNPDFAP